jgi:hexosaminidase
MSPRPFCYLDYYQADPENEPLAIGGFLPLEKVYSYEPVPEKIDQDKAKHILGAQGNVWTEYIKTFRDVEYMVFPRMTAIAEIVWSQPENKDYPDFSNRIKMHVPLFKALDINYSKTGMP